MWEGFSSRSPISRYCSLWLMPHGFVQSHIGERHLPHMPYKLEPKTRVPPHDTRTVLLPMKGTPLPLDNTLDRHCSSKAPFNVGGFLVSVPNQQVLPYYSFWLMPHAFVRSHIGERRLPHVPYKLELKTHVYHYQTILKFWVLF